MPRPVALRLVTAAAAATLACRGATDPLPAGGRALALRFSSGGFGGELVDVRLAGDTVVRVSRDFFAPKDSTLTRHVPGAAEWEGFWRAVDAAGVRRWPGECVNPGIVDGGGFRFELAWDGGRRTGSYGNSYPTRRGGCTRDGLYSDEARAFEAAVHRLAGVPELDGR